MTPHELNVEKTWPAGSFCCPAPALPFVTFATGEYDIKGDTLVKSRVFRNACDVSPPFCPIAFDPHSTQSGGRSNVSTLGLKIKQRVHMKCWMSPLIIGLVLVCFGQIANAQSESDRFAELFGENCQYPCFLGIQPGITTLSELEFQLAQQGIAYRYENSQLQWELPDQELLTDGTGLPFVAVTFTGGVVSQFSAPLNVSIQTVTEMFGSPSQITEYKGRYYLVYRDLGLAIAVDSLLGDVGRTDEIYVTEPNSDYGIVG